MSQALIVLRLAWGFLFVMSSVLKMAEESGSIWMSTMVAIELLFAVLCFSRVSNLLVGSSLAFLLSGFVFYHISTFARQCNCFGGLAFDSYILVGFEVVSVVVIFLCLLTKQSGQPNESSIKKIALGLLIIVPAAVFTRDHLKPPVIFAAAATATFSDENFDSVDFPGKEKILTGDWLVVFQSDQCKYCHRIQKQILNRPPNGYGLFFVNVSLEGSTSLGDRLNWSVVSKPVNLNVPTGLLLSNGKIQSQMNYDELSTYLSKSTIGANQNLPLYIK